MKRSQINQIMRDVLAFCERHHFHLPPFAFWSPADWQSKGPRCRWIVQQQLGWDITDFGLGDFDRQGLFLFTIRNGTLGGAADAGSKPYAEKLLIARENQITPTHFHWNKVEDIINRGAGELVCQLWNSDGDDTTADTDVTIVCDGVAQVIPAGGKITLKPGESVTLPTRLWHKFWAAQGKGTALIGEVSMVNDDHTDNCFLEPLGRFPKIDEDEPPLHLLTIDYATYYQHA
jgi:D-lyxose ketol-isomerase